MAYKCDCCGQVAAIHQRGPSDSASCIEPSDPPNGWRAIYTMIEEHDGEGGVTRSAGEVLYSCFDCNAQMTVDEHHEAEHDNRLVRMSMPKHTSSED